MGANERKNRDKAMAAHLKAIGYPHGRRMSSPSPASLLRRDQVGSNNYVRYVERSRRGNKNR
jgi:hypothetical protein